MNPPAERSNAWPAPAKLNLFLHITGRRADGYHELQTVFQLLDFGDRLRFRVRNDAEINRLTPVAGVQPEHDLTVRAARLLQQFGGRARGVDIEIDKRIPMGGGLGGGSSDAATVLVALNQLWELGLDTNQLAQLGLSLGADVPVFVRGESAWAEGVGEQLQPVQLPEAWFFVLCPNVSIPTAELFASPQLTRDARPITIRDYLAGAGNYVVKNTLKNVFEPVVRERYPAVNEAITWLTQASGVQARMTGTGSSIFVAVNDEQHAQQLMMALPRQWQAFYARGVNRSPLFSRLEKHA
ncbi:MAG: 4-(cytidine 5'-diphospho)-2-C-methyl-D-erythritol kinase [Gammaproteobacteria bacterium]|nr:4-(cytidine 5'-diphospho)-2-C-methyl-D-erythritol kinase [Gammaproteobacteria bacterium]